jgi:hypothetical protein
MKILPYWVAGLRPARPIFARWVAFPLFGLSAALMLARPCAGAPFQFEQTGSMHQTRISHTATLLSNGNVLAAGGDISADPSTELYNQATGRWSTTGSLGTARNYHTATLLPNGKVLVAGGLSTSSLASAELTTRRAGNG